MSNRTLYDPDPDMTYAKCKTCGINLPDEETANRHRSETMTPVNEGAVTARGHATTTLNPSRATRVRRAIENILEDAASDDPNLDLRDMTFTLSDGAADEATDTLMRKVDEDYYSAREVDAALASYPDFQKAWKDASDWETRTANDPPPDHPTLPLDEVQEAPA